MPQAVNNSQSALMEIVVDFDNSIQSLGPLEAAAYRLIGTATCQIDRVADRFACRLTQTVISHESSDDLKVRFLNLVADENMRSRVAEKTEGVRNVILALAFGSLATTEKDTE
jgi:His-Xaa-Ser system protein HxsD